jgi:hypothetical protein
MLVVNNDPRLVRRAIWSDTEGRGNGPIELHRGRRYWVAAYRHSDALKKPRTEQEVEAAVRPPIQVECLQLSGALKYGWKAFRGDHSHALTSNSTVLRPSRMPQRRSVSSNWMERDNGFSSRRVIPII